MLVKSAVINGDVWKIVTVPNGDGRLTDRTGSERLATTDQDTRSIYILESLRPPLLDKVMVHEVAHAVTISYNLLESIRKAVPPQTWIAVEEWSAQLVENHGLEAYRVASDILGRPVCVNGICT